MDLKTILEHHLLDHVWARFNLAGLDLPISKHLFMMWIAGGILLVILPLIMKSRGRILAPFRQAVEMLVVFLRDDIVIANLGKKGSRYTSYFCTLFFFILTCNLLGMVPFGSTATGNIAVTGGMALTTFAMVNFVGMREQGFAHYMKNIVPSGVPIWLFPLLFPIEIIGLLTKTFALCIRLFANMIAGHIVILSLIALIFIFGDINPFLGLAVTAPAAILLVLFVSALEIFVAALQAYIFTFLTAIFVGAAMNPH